MNKTALAFLAFVVFDLVAAHGAHGNLKMHRTPINSQSIIKTVPAGATLEYRINGQVSQSMPIEPGIYRITVERMR